MYHSQTTDCFLMKAQKPNSMSTVPMLAPRMLVLGQDKEPGRHAARKGCQSYPVTRPFVSHPHEQSLAFVLVVLRG